MTDVLQVSVHRRERMQTYTVTDNAIIRTDRADGRITRVHRVFQAGLGTPTGQVQATLSAILAADVEDGWTQRAGNCEGGLWCRCRFSAACPIFAPAYQIRVTPDGLAGTLEPPETTEPDLQAVTDDFISNLTDALRAAPTIHEEQT